MESDLFALSVYKYEYETPDEQEDINSPRCEKITVYNTIIDEKAPWLNMKFYQEAIRRRYNERYAIVVQDRQQ